MRRYCKMPDMFACLSYVFIMTITPGPNNMVCLVNATKFGFRRTLPFLSGLAVGVIVIMIGSSYLNLSLSRFIPSFRPIAEVFGGLYMTYLAVRILRSEGVTADADTGSATFAMGFGMQFINAKLILYALTVTANFVTPYYQSFIAIVLICTFLGCVSAMMASCWALFGTAIQHFFGKYRKIVNTGMALLLLYAALSISGLLTRIGLLTK
jgi:cysteine/O-acetylserine efflux protein